MADNDILKLAGEFDAATHGDWLTAAGQVLNGRTFEQVLGSVTADGIGIEPLYVSASKTQVPQFPATGTSRRASNPAGTTMGWDIRQLHGLWSTEGQLNRAILTDLERGVTSVELVNVDNADLAAILSGVHLDLAPVALKAKGDGTELARRFLALVDSSNISPSPLVADLGCDPIGRLAQRGGLGLPVDEAVSAVAALAVEVAGSHGSVRTIRAEGLAFANAGATSATELAATVSSAVTYLRALVDAGLGVGQALSQILLSVSVGTDQFGDIAKLRALRVLWSRVSEASGAPDHVASIQATTSTTTATEFDPWVNILRTTIGCFSAATGGADIITVRPFDAGLGVPDELGIRLARNTQLALMEESNVHRVIDPSGGSWYVETLTDQIADAAWLAFQRLESLGGIVASLRSGAVQADIAEQAARQAAAVATRRRTITGVTEFANLSELSPHRDTYPTDRHAVSEHEVEPLPVRPLAARFEQLRRQAATAASEPSVFVASLGPHAAHAARTTWAVNFFAAGGIRATLSDGFETPEAVSAAFTDNPSEIAVLCSSDETYQQWAVAAAQSLRAGGAKRVYLAGDPGEYRASYQAGGVDEFIHVGCDVLAGLRQAHQVLGLEMSGASA